MDRTGEIWHGIEIIAYRKSIDIDIKFPDGTVLYNVDYGNLKNKSIKNPFKPRICDIGYIGTGIYNYADNLTAYRTWEGMLRRCYNEKHQNNFPSYKGCSVVKEWHNFQVFAEWFYKNYKDDFQLDKDLTIIENKVYGPEYCSFIPQDLNKMLTGKRNSDSTTPTGVYPCKNKFKASVHNGLKRVYLGSFENETDAFNSYKIAKESYVKEQANRYMNEISEVIYQNLMNYIVKP